MAIIKQVWTREQEVAVKRLHRLGVWREVYFRQEDRVPEDRGFNSVWFDVFDEVDLHEDNTLRGLDKELVLSEREYRSAKKWLGEYERLFDDFYENHRRSD